MFYLQLNTLQAEILKMKMHLYIVGPNLPFVRCLDE